EDEEVELIVDTDGRIPVAGTLDYQFRSFSAAVPAAKDPKELQKLVADCEAAFNARAREGQYSTGETYWVQADSEPRCALEALALAIFREHTQEARFAKDRSGAEWWTQVVDAEDDGIGFHFDKDYALETAGVNIHPAIGTVTSVS
ncbi:unnamed protein product, partial [Phaeothamnion confervicola]